MPRVTIFKMIASITALKQVSMEMQQEAQEKPASGSNRDLGKVRDHGLPNDKLQPGLEKFT